MEALERRAQGHSCNHYCNGKAIRVTSSEKVFVALCIYYAMRMRHIVIGGLPDSFPHYLIHGTLSEKNVIEHKMCFFYFLYNLCPKNLTLRRNERDIMKNILVIM